MIRHAHENPYGTTNVRLLLAHLAGLELEVDRLRRQGQFVHDEVRAALKEIHATCRAGREAAGADTLDAIDRVAVRLAGELRELREPPGYHPAHDQVIAVAIRPLVEKVFRWQQRLTGSAGVSLRLELATESVEWFPARLRQILDNLLANALRNSDRDGPDAWVSVGLREDPNGYELRVAGNRTGLTPGEREEVWDLFDRSAPARAAGLGYGLAVVRLLVEQSGGTLGAVPAGGEGAAFVATLPRYDVDDFLS
jgi:signal transduction histidine kinase